MRTLLKGVPHALAQPVCDALLGEGIESRVVRPFTSFAGYGPTPPAEIVILNDDDTSRALSAAAECVLGLASQAAEEAEIDLSKLSPALRVACPACERELDPRLAVEGTIACACGARHDIVELIVNQHGPEALEGCTTTREAADDAPTLMHATVKCIHCGYELEGLARRGICPECGKPYDKAVCVLHPYLAAEFKK
ncbi:MAG: hypothetical protein IT434_10955 [Phycisphaerales bacterium]|jgi:hypothetical protein|nr:hypothetical protein [Phycisphaerales bacterium]